MLHAECSGSRFEFDFPINPEEACELPSNLVESLKVTLRPMEVKPRIGFPSYALENPGVWGWHQGALRHHDSQNGNRKFTIFAILHLPTIKTVVGTCLFYAALQKIFDTSR